MAPSRLRRSCASRRHGRHTPRHVGREPQPDASALAWPTECAAALRRVLHDDASGLRAALELVRDVTGSVDLDVVVAETVAAAMAVARCPVGALYLLDEAEQRLWIRATSAGFEWLVGTYSLDVGRRADGLDGAQPDAGGRERRPPRRPALRLGARGRSRLPLGAHDPADRRTRSSRRRADAARAHAAGFAAADVEALSPIAGLAASAIDRAQLLAERRQLSEFAGAISALDDPVTDAGLRARRPRRRSSPSSARCSRRARSPSTRAARPGGGSRRGRPAASRSRRTR